MKLWGITFLLLATTVFAQTRPSSSRPAPAIQKPLLIQEIHVSGTRSLDTAQLNEIIGPLNQAKVRSSDEISQRLRLQFQNFGYLSVEVKSLQAKPLDPLAVPTPVAVEAEVSEGPRFRFGEIQFSGIHALTAEQLKENFPIHTGEFFSRNKLGTGLEATRKAYAKLGYIDMYSIPDMQVGADIVSLTIEVTEGNQYRLATLEFAGNPEAAEQLRPRWELGSGKPFDYSYVQQFLKENASLFPSTFDREKSVTVAKNCRENTVALFFELSPNHPNVVAPKDIDCGQDSKETKK
jgi:outer membrane protein assembly factor BamA